MKRRRDFTKGPNINEDEVNFEVLSSSPANKPGYVVAEVRFKNSSKVYTYVRKEQQNDGSFIIDGCKVTPLIDTHIIERLYDTAGVKRPFMHAGISKKIKSQVDELEQEDSKEEEVIEAIEEKPEEVEEVIDWANEVVKHEKYELIKSCIVNDIPVFLTGPAGSGKNFTLEQIANDLGYDFYTTNAVQQEFKITGFIDAGGDYHETEFYKACTSENKSIFFLDEIDASIPEVLVLLNGAIANGYFEFPTGRVYLENVKFVAAGNTVGSGADENYTGRFTLDQATLDRFAIIEFGYSKAIEMKLSEGNEELVNYIRKLRDYAEKVGVRATFSYRCISMVTKLEKTEVAKEDIMKIAVFKGLDKDTISTLRHVASGNKYEAYANLMQM